MGEDLQEESYLTPSNLNTEMLMSTFSDSKRPPELPRTGGAPLNRPANATVLTVDCEFKGALAFSGDLLLDGRLEGTIESDGGTLTIGEDALVKAEIKVSNVIVYGKVQGNILSSGRVELRGKAHVYGDIRSGSLALESGVTFVGRSESLSGGKQEAPADFSKIFNRLGAPAKVSSSSSHSATSSGE